VLIGRKRGEILGAHLVGHGAAEVIHAFALAMRHGLPAGALTDMAYASFTSDVRLRV
jgi:glutathione reductase (NADPH)